MNPSSLCRLAVAVLVMGLVGCGPSRMALKPSFWTETQQKVGVATLPPPKLGAYRAGSQGLLDIAINSAMAGSLEAHLQTVDVSRFAAVADEYVARLNERGLNARKLAQPVDLTRMKPFTTGGSEKFAEKDLRPLAEKEQLDTLILLSLEQCGTMRPYYGFIPLGPPQALCVARGEMVDLKTNAILWRAIPEREQTLLPVAGEWDQPPDFRNVTASIQQSVNSAQAFLLKDFFEAGKAAPVASKARP